VVVGQSVVKIAVDPHKRINAVVAVDAAGSVLGRSTFAQSTTGFADLMTFARRWPRREWAVEGATGVGKNLAQRLVAKGETVFDVPSKKSSLVRAFSATSGRKSDDVDAYSVALASLHSDLLQVRVDERAETLRLLSNRRDELVGLRTQAVCRLHRELQILIPGGASRALTAAKAKALLASVRPRDEVGKVRKSLALDQLADLAAIDKRLKDIGTQIKTVVADTATSVTEVRGVGPVVAAIVLGEVRDVSRFPTKHHFASYNGTAPTTWGSAGDARPCVNLHGNRRLNHAIHIAAIVQLRFDCEGRRYSLRKIADGKTPKEARRCLKRRISDAIYHQLVADAQAGERGPGGQMGATTKISAADPAPTVDSSIKPQPGPHRKGNPAASIAS
jgi:transposase